MLSLFSWNISKRTRQFHSTNESMFLDTGSHVRTNLGPDVILDLAAGDVQPAIDCDVCVIGAGPAGIALALELEDSGLRVAVLESGDRRTALSRAPLAAAHDGSNDFEVPHGERRVGFGGTAGAWSIPLSWRARGVRYAMLSVSDLEARASIPFSGWPIKFDELTAYVDRALALAGIAGSSAELDDRAHDEGEAWFDGSRIVVRREYIGHADVFTRRALSRLRRSETVTVYLHATAVRLEDGAGSVVESLRVAGPGGEEHRVRAPRFVLAGGAIENARLLLNSGDAERGGLGNQHGWVGRGYHDHLRLISGRLIPTDPTLFDHSAAFAIQRDHRPPRMARFGIADHVLQTETMLNSLAQLIPRPADRYRHGPAQLMRAMRQVRQGKAWAAASTVRSALPGLAHASRTAVELVRAQRSLPPSPETGWGGLPRKSQRFTHFEIEHQVEQAPNPENRVVLGKKSDRFGTPLAELRWRWSGVDLQSVRRTQELFREETQRAGIGEYIPQEWDQRPELTTPAGAAHPGGTTRMAEDPTLGVVDADCRVHGISNLFVAGGSVFPTGGAANPTLTILALAIRLADQIRSDR